MKHIKTFGSITSRSGLTEFEVIGLKTAFNFADGHAYHNMPRALQPIIDSVKDIWKESVSKQVPELEERFKRATSRIMGSPILGNHEYYSLCPTASNSIDIAGAWLAFKDYNVGLLEPAFDNLYLLLKRRQVKIIGLSEEDLIKLNSLSKKIDDNNLKSIFIISPNNPTGFELDASEFHALSELCARKGVAIILDKTFRLFSRTLYDEYQILTNSKADYLVIEDTGKTWPTHETKVSLMAYSESIAKELRCLYEEVYLCHSKFAVNLLSHIIERTHEVGIKNVIWDEIDKRKSKIDEALKGTVLSTIRNEKACSMPFEWIECLATGLTDLQLVEQFKKYGVAILPGRYFYWNSENKHTKNIRISLLRSDGIFEKGLVSIRRAIQSI